MLAPQITIPPPEVLQGATAAVNRPPPPDLSAWETDDAHIAELPAAYAAVQNALGFIIKKPTFTYYEFYAVFNGAEFIELPFRPFCPTTDTHLALFGEHRPFSTRDISDPLNTAEYEWTENETARGGGEWSIGYQNRRLYIAKKFQKGIQIRLRYCAGRWENTPEKSVPDTTNIPPEIKEAVQETAQIFRLFAPSARPRFPKGIPPEAYEKIKHLIAK